MRYNYSVFIKQDEGVQSLIKWQFEENGSFFTYLWKAISAADLCNLEMLRRAYPKHVRAYDRYRLEAGWWEELLNELRTPEVR